MVVYFCCGCTSSNCLNYVITITETKQTKTVKEGNKNQDQEVLRLHSYKLSTFFSSFFVRYQYHFQQKPPNSKRCIIAEIGAETEGLLAF